jgi:hypothetical protein
LIHGAIVVSSYFEMFKEGILCTQSGYEGRFKKAGRCAASLDRNATTFGVNWTLYLGTWTAAFDPK